MQFTGSSHSNTSTLRLQCCYCKRNSLSLACPLPKDVEVKGIAIGSEVMGLITGPFKLDTVSWVYCYRLGGHGFNVIGSEVIAIGSEVMGLITGPFKLDTVSWIYCYRLGGHGFNVIGSEVIAIGSEVMGLITGPFKLDTVSPTARTAAIVFGAASP